MSGQKKKAPVVGFSGKVTPHEITNLKCVWLCISLRSLSDLPMFVCFLT